MTVENTCPDEYRKIILRMNAEATDVAEELHKAEAKLHALGYTKNYLKDGAPWEELA